MFNFYYEVVNNPGHFRQLACNDALITTYNCPLENKFEDAWSHRNYIIYVIEGKKIWHTPQASYELKEGSCVFVRKGACIVEQFFDTPFCLVMFFVPDEFICDVLKNKPAVRVKPLISFPPIISIEANENVQAFFMSMMPHFRSAQDPDPALLELKFRELVLTMADNPRNTEMLSYFCFMLQEPQAASLRQVMEDNYCFNLKLEQFAQLSNRSLSAFKRDFQKLFSSSPGKWLVEKRLHHARHLLSNLGKTVSEAAFESGFENASHFSRTFRNYFGIMPTLVKQQQA